MLGGPRTRSGFPPPSGRVTPPRCGLVLLRRSQVLQVVSIPDGVVLPQSEREVLLRFEEPTSHRVFNVLSRVDIGQEELLEIETHVGVVAADDDDTHQ